MPKAKAPIRLSASNGLNLFKECPRCFWLHHNEHVHRPRGIFPSLPGGMDAVFKTYFDRYRGGLPPELEGKVPGVLMPDGALMNQWRNWRAGLRYQNAELDASLSGALDDCLVAEDRYVALDYKTRGSAPKAGASEQYYQTQLDVYTLLLDTNGFPAADYAYLVYYYPKRVEEHGIVHFHVRPVKVATNAERARELFAQAVRFLRGPLPAQHSDCDYCTWNAQLSGFD